MVFTGLAVLVIFMYCMITAEAIVRQWSVYVYKEHKPNMQE